MYLTDDLTVRSGAIFSPSSGEPASREGRWSLGLGRERFSTMDEKTKD